MHRLSKAILIILCGLIALAVAAVVGVNLYVQSPGTQAQIQAQLSKAAGLPLQITSTTITPWGGLHMSGISVPAEGGTQIDGKSFDAQYQLVPLLHGQLVVDKMTLDSPRFYWVQNANGEWVLPALPETEARPKSTPSPETHAPKEKGPAITVGAMEIVNGSFELVDAGKNRVLLISNIQISASLTPAGMADGAFTADRISYADALNFSKIHSGLHFQDGKLSLHDFESSISGGSAGGNMTFEFQNKATPYQGSLSFDKIDLARLTAEANWQAAQSGGLLNAQVDLQGDLQKFADSEGKGRLSIGDAKLGEIQSLQTITQVLQFVGLIFQVPDLAELHFAAADADFRIANQHAYIDRLLLQKNDLQFGAKGNFRFDGRISFDAKLGVSKRIWGSLPEGVLASLTPPDASEQRFLDFTISGRADKPKTDLREKIQFGDILDGLFGGKKKNDKKKDAAPDSVDAPNNATAKTQPPSTPPASPNAPSPPHKPETPPPAPSPVNPASPAPTPPAPPSSDT